MKILRAIYTLCAAALLLSSCQDEEMIKQSGVKEGIPVTIDLTFSAVIPEQEQVGTRAITDPEYRVNDLYVLIFNANTGALKGNVLSYDFTELGDDQKEIQQDGETTLQGTLSQIKTTTGESVIYAIANVQADNHPSEYSASSNGKTLVEQIEAVKSIEELEKITADLYAPNSSNALFRISGTHYIMSGATDKIMIAESNNNINIPLYRTDSKVTFNIVAGKGSYSKCTNFTLLSYQVCKIAKKTSLVPLAEGQNYDTGNESADNYWDTESGVQPEEANTITFYVPENIKSAANDANITEYKSREEWNAENSDKDNPASVSNREFTNAPAYGTYVVLHGLFEGEAFTSNYHPENEEGNQFVDEDVDARATVDYIIHLGDWTNDGYSSFSNKRNYEYTYTITVNGVDDIVVEVEKEDNPENEPGAEGDVFFQNGVFYNIDCHNVALLMEFTKQEIDNVGESEDYFQAVINSPFGAEDKDWLRFVLNEKDNENNYERTLHSYPGDPGQITNAETIYLTLDELMEALKSIRDAHKTKRTSIYEDAAGDLVVTCFVKEYTYDDYTSYLGAGSSAPANSDNWGLYTNKANREAYIFGAINYSPDGNSSTIHTKYVVSQRSIQTMDEYYNNGNGIGLGIETYNETGQIEMGNPNKKPDSPSDGLNNMKSMLESSGAPGYKINNQTMWGYTAATPNGTYNEYQSFPDDYRAAAYACLLRNRDENGDGEIKEDEIKWYLPALDQYTAFYVGLDALSNSSRFFMPENHDTYSEDIRRHYFAGTWGTSDDGSLAPYIIWAEEGIGTQVFKGGDYGSGSTLGDARDYRCIRNLGSGNREPFFTYDSQSRIITLNHLVSGVFRDPINSISNHNENEHANNLYEQFQIAENYLDKDNDGRYLEQPEGNDDGDTWLDTDLENEDPCRSYREGGHTDWRLPNQRELLVMMTTKRIFTADDFEDKNGNIKSCHKVIGKTTYSYYDKNTQKYRYFIQATGGGDSGDNGVTGFIMQLQDASKSEAERRGFIRCVRDVVE